MIRRPIIGTAQANGADQLDTLKVSAHSPSSTSDLEHLFGLKEEVGCNMELSEPKIGQISSKVLRSSSRM